MKLGKEIVAAIKKEVAQHRQKFFIPFQSEWHRTPFHVQLGIEEGDRLALQMNTVRIGYRPAPRVREEQLLAILSRVQNQITYLPEDLRIVEVDKQRLQARLCSKDPYNHGKTIEYFQLQVNAELEITLQRIHNHNHHSRTIGFVLPYELLERLLNDCFEIVSESVE